MYVCFCLDAPFLSRFFILFFYYYYQVLAGIEPSLLKEKFLTDQDKVIQETDRPERLQLRMPTRGEARCVPRETEGLTASLSRRDIGGGGRCVGDTLVYCCGVGG